MGINSGKSSTVQSVRGNLTGISAAPVVEAGALSPIPGYSVGALSDDFKMLLLSEGIGSTNMNPEEEKNLMGYYNNILPLFNAEIKKIDDGLSENIKSAAGSFTDFVKNGVFTSSEEFEKFVYQEIAQQVETTLKDNVRLSNLEIPYVPTRTGEALKDAKDKMEKRLLKTQESMLAASQKCAAGVEKILTDIFPNVAFDSDGNMDFEGMDLNGINMTSEKLDGLNNLLRNYSKTIAGLPYVSQYYSHTAISDYKKEVLGISKFPMSASKMEELTTSVNEADSDRITTFLGGMNKIISEVKRDNDRATRFVSGERFWANDDAGGMYSNGVNGGQTIIYVPAAIKMSAIYANEDLRRQRQHQPEGRGGELLREHPEEVAAQLAGLVLHEYAHRVSQQETRGLVETTCGFQFRDVAVKLHAKAKALGPRGAALFHDDLGGYALASPSEFYAEAFKFLHLNRDRHGEYEAKFKKAGLSREFDFLLKTLGIEK